MGSRSTSEPEPEITSGGVMYCSRQTKVLLLVKSFQLF
jgi:hypothetical protein